MKRDLSSALQLSQTTDTISKKLSKILQAIKHDGFWIPRSTVFPDVLASEPLFHVNPSGLIKANIPLLHDLSDPLLAPVVQAPP